MVTHELYHKFTVYVKVIVEDLNRTRDMPLVIYLNLCPLFTPRFAHLPECVKSLEKVLTPASAEIILVARRAYFPFRLLLCVSVYVVYVLSDLTRCSRFGHWFPPNQPTTRQTGAWRGTRCSSAPHLHPADCLELILAVVCCVGGVPHVLIREMDAPGPRCCRWFRVIGSTDTL